MTYLLWSLLVELLIITGILGYQGFRYWQEHNPTSTTTRTTTGKFTSDHIDESLNLTISRLEKLIKTKKDQSIISFSIASLLAVHGLAILGLATSNLITKINTESLNVYVPILLLVVLIEIFSLVFFCVYKQCVGKIQLYQTELNRIEFKCLNLRVACEFQLEKVKASIIKDLNSNH